MSAVAVPRQTETPALEMPRENYLTDGYGIKSWLLTLDHKRIGILYMVSVSVFFLMGALFALTIPPGVNDSSGRPARGRNL